MSVEYRTAIIVGIPFEKFPLELIPEDKIDDFTDNYFIDTDSWCGGEEFIGKILKTIDEGGNFELTPFTFSKMWDIETDNFVKEIQNFLDKYNIRLILPSPNIYVINQVF